MTVAPFLTATPEADTAAGADARPRPDPDDDEALLRLLAAGGAAAPRRALLEAHGGAGAALRAGSGAWRRAGLAPAQVRALEGGAAADPRARDWLARPGHHLLGWHDPDYPPLLRAIPSPPLALFVAGEPALLWHPAVAIVGSRSPSAGGRDNARAFAHALAGSGLAVTSGLALGIDTTAHLAALAAGGTTVAVVGSGLDFPYPRANAALQARIAAAGAVVSEHPPGTRALREHFPSRNRIIAGLTLGTLVVEAARRSGALITARQAAEAGREVFAVPGSIHNPVARGCHRLIREGAALVERADEVIATLAPLASELGGALRRRLDAPSSLSGTPSRGARGAPGADDPDYNRLWQALGHDPTGMDLLLERTGLTTAQLSSMLLVMELEGWIVAEHGRYSRTS
ncbi:DNA-processing protein DprA [Luteimonas sp. RD2P54]|uniref:DNA-processing protein DprA n=1 Tax=Luteimonas endophytica TaxID=3042023 RepID=A0ABT6J539_9GAMM|nr:DNA-processing protein DprA [Luteimonas endophytica]MDH5821937.1 DNA-processing protein DprA [Luteimonas endophytica]